MERIEKLLAFLKNDPKDNFVRHALAMEYLKIDRVEEAQQLLENLLHDSPDYVGSYYHLAKILEKKGDTDAAVHWYEFGIKHAQAAGNRHTANELRSALDELLY